MIVTHVSPDIDAIASCWLLQRFGGLDDEAIAFVNTGSPDPAILAEAQSVVDTGRVYDPKRLRFDHHHLPGVLANEQCAAAMVYDALCEVRSDLGYLAPLVALVNSGDTGRQDNGADWSRSLGIHALLSAQKARRLSDADLLAFGYSLLDLLAERLQGRQEAARALETAMVYRSADGLVWALDGAPQGATWAAFEAGARLVVFHSPGEETTAVGVQRAGEWQEPHCGTLVLAAMERPTDAETRAELATWFRHNAGFFSGRGTAKAPDPRPLAASFVGLAQAIDEAWRR